MPKHILSPDQFWEALLTGVHPPFPGRELRHLLRLVPGAPRCKFCNAPQDGAFRGVMRLVGKGPSRLTPQLCTQCEEIASQYLGGAEIELTMLFADVRGSTPLAEQLGSARFSELISRFFGVAADVMLRRGALVDKLVGDQASGLFVPGFAGPHHRQLALDSALELLHATGHHSAGGPWIPVGIGLHTGVAFVGAVGAQGRATDVTALGDAPNVTARLSSAAAAGEILMTREAASPEAETSGLEVRSLELKGKSRPVSVFVIR